MKICKKYFPWFVLFLTQLCVSLPWKQSSCSSTLGREYVHLPAGLRMREYDGGIMTGHGSFDTIVSSQLHFYVIQMFIQQALLEIVRVLRKFDHTDFKNS